MEYRNVLRSFSVGLILVLSILTREVFAFTPSTSLQGSRKSTSTNYLRPGSSFQQLYMGIDIEEFSDAPTGSEMEDNRTDEEKGLTHGYEGNFKVGNKVRVIKQGMRFWHVKPYMKDGFDPYRFSGIVNSLVLYGRKKKTLCSAITPIRVEFFNGEGIPEGMFEKKWFAHFDHTELELIEETSS